MNIITITAQGAYEHPVTLEILRAMENSIEQRMKELGIERVEVIAETKEVER